jgi:hypothetical protein
MRFKVQTSFEYASGDTLLALNLEKRGFDTSRRVSRVKAVSYD